MTRYHFTHHHTVCPPIVAGVVVPVDNPPLPADLGMLWVRPEDDIAGHYDFYADLRDLDHADSDEGVAEPDADMPANGLEPLAPSEIAAALVAGEDVHPLLIDPNVHAALVVLVGEIEAGDIVASFAPLPESGEWVDTAALGDELVASLTDTFPGTDDFVVVRKADFDRLMDAARDAGLEDTVGNFDVIPVELDR